MKTALKIILLVFIVALVIFLLNGTVFKDKVCCTGNFCWNTQVGDTCEDFYCSSFGIHLTGQIMQDCYTPIENVTNSNGGNS